MCLFNFIYSCADSILPLFNWYSTSNLCPWQLIACALQIQFKHNKNSLQVGGKYSSPSHKVLGQGVLMWPIMKMGFVVFSDGRLWDIAAAFYLNRKYEIDFSYMSINEYYTLTIVNLNLRYSNLPVGSLPLWQAFIHICSPIIYSKMLLFIQSLWFSVQLPLQTNDLGNNWDYSEEN